MHLFSFRTLFVTCTYIYVTDCNRVEVTLLASLFEYEVCISRCMSSQVALAGTNHDHEG